MPKKFNKLKRIKKKNKVNNGYQSVEDLCVCFH